MATMRPPLHELDRLVVPLNDGERRVAERLNELDDEWTIYVQPRLTHDVPDFIAVHDRFGVCAIEVKHWSTGAYRAADRGGVECRSGGAWQAIDEAPRFQAHRYRQTIYEQFFAHPQDGEYPTAAVRALLVLPEWETSRATKLFVRHQVTPNERQVRVVGGDLLERGFEPLVRGACTPPNAMSITRLHRHLVESDAVREFRRPARLSEGARNIASNPNNSRMRRIRGSAGCGKTFGLAARAARLARDGKQVLVLTFNTTLANYLRTLVGARCKELQANAALVTCVPFHSFCGRLAEDAKQAGFTVPDHGELDRWDADVRRAGDVLQAGFERCFDAVLVDEGQDFTLEWWNLLRRHVVREGGEMLLVADPTQDVYEKKAWTDEERMLGAGFSGPWTELSGSYRMPRDLVPITNRFSQRFLDGERLAGEVPPDLFDIAGASATTVRKWVNVRSVKLIGTTIGHEVVDLLHLHPDLNPNDLVFLCEHHDVGIDAVRVIEEAGYDVHHVFATRERDRARRKRRFWPDAPGVKGCTVHSFKGWETPALVMGIGNSAGSRRLAYVAMTRLRSSPDGRPSYISVINGDLAIAGFESTFTQWGQLQVAAWAPPLAGERLR